MVLPNGFGVILIQEVNNLIQHPKSKKPLTKMICFSSTLLMISPKMERIENSEDIKNSVIR